MQRLSSPESSSGEFGIIEIFKDTCSEPWCGELTVTPAPNEYAHSDIASHILVSPSIIFVTLVLMLQAGGHTFVRAQMKGTLGRQGLFFNYSTCSWVQFFSECL